jgi:hypothetical protein
LRKLGSLNLLLIITMLMLSAACSKHWREGDPGILDEDLMTYANESLQNASASGFVQASDVERFNQILNDENTTIFFAESNEFMGPAQNVTAMVSWDFLGVQGLDPLAVDHVRVIFLDLPYAERNENAVLFDITSQGQHIVKIYFNDSMSTDVEPTFFDNGEFVSQMSSSDGSNILLRSFDTEDDLLQSVIQLEIYEYDGNGTELLTGKVTTLVGFEPE